MDGADASITAAASRAAAALVAALRQPSVAGRAGEAAAAAFGADPEVAHCSIAVVIDGGGGSSTICSSGNLLQAHEASSLHCGVTSLAGLTIAQRRPRLLHSRLPRRHVMQDAAAILSECATVQTLVCLPLLWPAHSHGGTSRTAIGALTVGYVSAPSAAALRRALLVAQTLAQEQRGELRSFAGLVSDMLLPQRLHASSADPSELHSDSDSDSDQGLFGSDWGWSSSGGSDAAPHSGDEAEQHGGRGGGVPAIGVAQHPLTLRFQEAEMEAEFARYQARCLQRVDALAYLFVLLLFGFEVVLPLRLGAWAGSPHDQPPGAVSLLALLPGLLPGLLLLHPRTHAWFSAHRDHLLLATWLYTAAYSRAQLAPRQLLGWLGVLGLALPMRFFRLLPLTLLASAQLLHAVSARQLVHTVLLPLACSWYFEAHSRAAFVRATHSTRRRRRR